MSKQLGPQGVRLAEFAKAAFLSAMESSLVVLAVVIAVAAALIALWSPGRDGKQLRLVRRLTTVRRTRSVGRHRA